MKDKDLDASKWDYNRAAAEIFFALARHPAGNAA